MLLGIKSWSAHYLKVFDKLYKHLNYFTCEKYCKSAATIINKGHLTLNFLSAVTSFQRLDYFLLRLWNHYNRSTNCNQSISYLWEMKVFDFRRKNISLTIEFTSTPKKKDYIKSITVFFLELIFAQWITFKILLICLI